MTERQKENYLPGTPEPHLVPYKPTTPAPDDVTDELVIDLEYILQHGLNLTFEVKAQKDLAAYRAARGAK